VRRAFRPSCLGAPSPLDRGASADRAGAAGATGATGAVSGASRLVLASSIVGGAPRLPLRFSFDRSAIGLHLVDEGLNEAIGLGI
jgi:hypothetical protein